MSWRPRWRWSAREAPPTPKSTEAEYTAVPFVIPLEFVRQHVQLTPSEIRYGVADGWLDPADAEILIDHTRTSIAASDLSAAEMLSEAADAPAEDTTAAAWLYLALAWLLDRHQADDGAVDGVIGIWCHFDHAPAVDHLVPWMPAGDGVTRGAAVMRARWVDWVRNREAFYAGRDSAT